MVGWWGLKTVDGAMLMLGAHQSDFMKYMWVDLCRGRKYVSLSNHIQMVVCIWKKFHGVLWDYCS
jgi:hypothetical protein